MIRSGFSKVCDAGKGPCVYIHNRARESARCPGDRTTFTSQPQNARTRASNFMIELILVS